MPNFSELTASRIDRLLNRSDVVLRGRVKATGAATEGVPASDDTAVVAVEEMLVSPDSFPDVTGREITVRLKGPIRRGQRAVFLVQSWMYSASVAVAEVDRFGGVGGGKALRAALVEGVERKGGRRVRERFAGADIVVAGVVVETRPASEKHRVRIDTEHDPEWWEAVVSIEETLKGRAQRRLVVLFPASTDEIWIDSPKLVPGQRALLALRRDQRERGGPGLWVRGLTALDPLDVQPLEELEQIRALIGRSR